MNNLKVKDQDQLDPKVTLSSERNLPQLKHLVKKAREVFVVSGKCLLGFVS